MVKQTEVVRPTRVEGVVDQPVINAVAQKVRPRLSEAAYLEKLVRLGKNSEGNEVPDPTVMEPPIGWVEAPTMVELIRKMIRDHDIEKGIDGEFETFEEADDFDVGDENAEELRSGWENDFEPEEVAKVKAAVEARMVASAASKKPPFSLGDDGGGADAPKKSGRKPKSKVDDEDE